jgi:hypothetical protein
VPTTNFVTNKIKCDGLVENLIRRILGAYHSRHSFSTFYMYLCLFYYDFTVYYNYFYRLTLTIDTIYVI